MAKGWIAQEYYNEYLSLKEKILDKNMELDYCRNHKSHENMIPVFEEDLDNLIERFNYVLDQLKLEGVDMRDLVLLSAGVDVNLFS